MRIKKNIEMKRMRDSKTKKLIWIEGSHYLPNSAKEIQLRKIGTFHLISKCANFVNITQFPNCSKL